MSECSLNKNSLRKLGRFPQVWRSFWAWSQAAQASVFSQRRHRSMAKHAAFNWGTATLSRALLSVLSSLILLTHIVSFFFFLIEIYMKSDDWSLWLERMCSKARVFHTTFYCHMKYYTWDAQNFVLQSWWCPRQPWDVNQTWLYVQVIHTWTSRSVVLLCVSSLSD